MASTVTRDVSPYAVVAGNPARIIKYRFEMEKIQKMQAVAWWNWESEKILSSEKELTGNIDAFLEKHYFESVEQM